MADRPVALTIAGSDSGAGAGLQADLLTFAALGVWGTTAATCLTAQNPAGVEAVEAVPASFVRAQIDAVDRYFTLAAVKTGMLLRADTIREVVRWRRSRPSIPLVVDPVMVATSGAVLLEPTAVAALRDELLPLATLVTPNLDETEVLLGSRPRTDEEMMEGARTLSARLGVAVLLKGGHLDGPILTDVLVFPTGRSVVRSVHRIDGVDTHGSGCTLAAAVAAGLARGLALEEAVASAQTYLHESFGRAVLVAGRRWIAHL